MDIKKAYKEFNELKTVKVWKELSEISGLIETIYFGASTAPFMMVAAGAEVGIKKVKKHIDDKQMERFEVLMKQYESNMNMSTSNCSL